MPGRSSNWRAIRLQMGAMEAARRRVVDIWCATFTCNWLAWKGDSTSIQAVLAGVPSRSAK
jgi:hypothetical protein